MIEIALSLAIIGFALVAIIGVLPIGMNVQEDNRQETVINQDSTVFMNAIRNGAQVDDLVNYVTAITNDVTVYQGGRPVGPTKHYGYTLNSCSGNVNPPCFLTGQHIVGLLSTPKYLLGDPKVGGFVSNHVVAYVRSISGPAYEKFPQNNPAVQDLAFSYCLTSEVIPYGSEVNLNGWSDSADLRLQANLHDVRLTFRWPLRSRGQLGPGGQAFRTLVGGLLERFDPSGMPTPTSAPYSAQDFYFFEPSTYVNVNVP